MKNHKSKILALCISSALLYGCGSDSDDPTMSVQAYDGPVRGMIANYKCDDGSKGTAKNATDDDGYLSVKNGSSAYDPQNCDITFTGTPLAVDMENGRDMSGVEYTAPKGLFSNGGNATASPLTTLLHKKLGDRAYDESTASDILESLGLSDIANSGVSIRDLLTKTESSVTKLKKSDPAKFSRLAAIKMVLSDALAADVPLDKLAEVTKKLSTALTTKYPNFPKNASGKEIVVNLKGKLADPDFITKVDNSDTGSDLANDPDISDSEAPATKPDRNDNKPPTGGTGGTGSGGASGGTGS